jgi:hypothetical protein
MVTIPLCTRYKKGLRQCLSMYIFRPTIRKAASALHWNICIVFELHGKLQKLEAFFSDLEAFTQVYSQIKRLYVEDVDNKK